MHEHIDEMGIINMNGRIYDPLIGRFMSADPYIQAPDDLQSHNRYAYVMNNPLNLDDPSGYFSISRAWKRAWKNPIFKAVLGIAVAFYAPQLLQSFFPTLFGASTLATTVATGALSGFASTGTLKGALTGAFTAGIMFGVGEIGVKFGLASGGVEKVALHAAAGCISSVAGGGSCKTGAISGALGELGNLIPSSSAALNTVKAAMLGGIGSKLAGGKFEDGAKTGAFGYLFNELLHQTTIEQQGYSSKSGKASSVLVGPAESGDIYNRKFMALDSDGLVMGTYSGSVDPDLIHQKNCANGCPRIASGEHDYVSGNRPKNGDVLIMGENGKVTTSGPNPNQNGNLFAKDVLVHAGYKTGTLELVKKVDIDFP